MNGAQLHLLLNHLPLIVPAIGALVVLAGVILDLDESKKVGLWIILVGALCAIGAYFSGEPAERVVKNFPGITRAVIREHQKWATRSFIFIEIVGVVTLALLFFLHTNRQIKLKYWLVFLLTCLISVIFFAQTSHLGGEIRHEEILSEDLV